MLMLKKVSACFSRSLLITAIVKEQSGVRHFPDDVMYRMGQK